MYFFYFDESGSRAPSAATLSKKLGPPQFPVFSSWSTPGFITYGTLSGGKINGFISYGLDYRESREPTHTEKPLLWLT